MSPIISYGIRLADNSDLYNSTSGGVFYSIASSWIKQGAQVWGACFDEKLNVVHNKADTLDELRYLRKSKYAQSDLKNTFRSIAETLATGRKVLFSGTPCQVAGLASFLGEPNSNLLLVQVFCAHVLSPGIWKAYIDYLENRYKSKIIEFDFRYKQPPSENTDNTQIGKAVAGWKRSCYRLLFADGRSEIIPWEKSVFANAFMDALLLRPSCSVCQFKLGSETCADLAIGDYWGCENTQPECFDPRGVSAVLAYTSHGKEVIESLNDVFKCESDASLILKGNPDTVNPRKAHANRQLFFEEYQNNRLDLISLINKYNGFLSVKTNKSYRIGLFGSYNTRMAIISMCKGSNSCLAYQYSNSSLISLMSSPIDFSNDVIMPANPFRKQMFVADAHKSFVFDIEQSMDIDYLVIDFVEERFGLIDVFDSCITESDALNDSSFTGGKHINRLSPELSIRWKDSCDRFIQFLKDNFDPERIILVRAFLSEQYIDSEGNRKCFENLDEIQSLNFCLSGYYDYFEKMLPNISVIELQNKELLYCEKDHKHGILPCHLNRDYIYKLAELITNSIISNEEKSN